MDSGKQKENAVKNTVLLIDDDPEVLKSLETILSWDGYRVVAKPDALAAMAVIKEGIRADVVVTDYWMPYMEGKDFLSKLKESLPATPVIVLTAAGSPETCRECFTRGAYAYLNKPIRIVDLEQIVGSAISKGKGQSAGEASS